MKIAVVTGASSGIGREFARQIPQLYRHLDELWVVARRTERLKELEKDAPLPVRIFDGDLRRDYIYERLQKELDRQNAEIRMLVNAAGYGKTGRFEEIPLADQLGMIDLNCRSLTKMTGICLPHLAGKSYVYRLSMALREELKGKGILVTAVCPGPVETEFFQISGELPGKLKTAFRQGVSEVVRQALKDAAKGKPVSVYGNTMKAARICGKILPDPLLASLMKRTNQIR